VFLGGGYFSGATFLDKSSMGSGAHVRAGTLLEEEAGGAHTVGFKQTIFLPFVTAGSLINFCDCLMGGGTSRKSHSEIGSSYIHFNYTPRQDKATASLIGDVPRGVMLRQPPIFLGGQGGLVGPARIAYGTVIPAGMICRQDVLDENQLYVPPPVVLDMPQKNVQGLYRGIHRIVSNNLIYIGNLQALKSWYRYARKKFMSGDVFAQACWAGAVGRIEACIGERIRRLRELAQKMPRSLELIELDGAAPSSLRNQQEEFLRRWPEMEQALACGPSEDLAVRERDLFLSEWNGIGPGTPYLEAVTRLSAESRAAGTAWLQAIVDSAAALWHEV
jgi:UDP-N-acetylglucosamine/UDP-N-acetylgalactosamine diphosphorylase